MNEHQKSRARGRYGESRLASKVNGVVVGRSKAIQLPSGKWVKVNCQAPPDVLTDLFSFENKHLKSLPKSIEKIMNQATRNAPEGFIPVGHIGDRIGRTYYFILTEQDFIDLLVNTPPSLIIGRLTT